MKISAYLSLVPLVVAAPVIDSRDASALDVKIERLGNSKIKAVVSNRGASALNVLKTGTVLDNGGVEKVHVYSKGMFWAGLTTAILH
jgi:deuterolysin